MKGRKKLFILAVLLSTILIISVVFSSGVVDISRFILGGSPESSPLASSSSPVVFVDPNTIVKDYVNDPGYQINDTFQVDVNITDATDLFAWQINLTWDPSMLNFSNVIAGEFLNRVTPPNYTTSSAAPNGLGFVINKTDNATGYAAMSESILGGVPAISGNGTLVTIEFQIAGYGWSNLSISVGGILPTTLLNHTISSMAFTVTDGYFNNKIIGDVDGDGWVDVVDLTDLSDAFGATPVSPRWDRECDFNKDDLTDVVDLTIMSDNFGRHL